MAMTANTTTPHATGIPITYAYTRVFKSLSGAGVVIHAYPVALYVSPPLTMVPLYGEQLLVLDTQH